MASGVDDVNPVTVDVLSCLAQSGYQFVGRYLCNGSNGSCLTTTEVGTFTAWNVDDPSAQVGIMLFWSSANSNSPSGWNSTNGSNDGSDCATQLASLAVPEETGITVYIDTEYTKALTPTQISNLGDYLRAFQQQLSGYWDIGLYGQGGTSSSNELQSICNANPWYASLPFWATNAQPSCGAAIIQLEDQPTVCDYTTDTDSTTTSVYGVWMPS